MTYDSTRDGAEYEQTYINSAHSTSHSLGAGAPAETSSGKEALPSLHQSLAQLIATHARLGGPDGSASSPKDVTG